MADWTDGPEYAPHDRPRAFVAPAVAPLSEADAAPSPMPAVADRTATFGGAPPSYTNPDAAPALAALVSPPPQPRDPHEAFDVVGSSMTAWSGSPDDADGQVRERRPEDPFPGSATIVASVAPPPPARQPSVADWPPPAPAPLPQPPFGQPMAGHPMAVQGPYAPVSTFPPAPGFPPPAGYPEPTGHPAPPPGTQGYPHYPGYGGPAPWQPQPQPTRPVSLGTVAQACTPGVLICLALGLLVQPLAAAMFLVAWALSTRIRYRRRTLSRTFLVVACALITVSLLDMLGTQGEFALSLLPIYANNWSTLAHLVLLVAVPVIVSQALSRGEPPQDPS